MSVLNIAFLPDAVWFGTDSMVYDQHSRPIRLKDRKAEVAPSGRFVWATRGRVTIGDRFDTVARSAGSVEEAAAMAPVFLEHAAPDRHSGDEITIAGYAASVGDLVVWQWKRRGDGPVRHVSLERGTYMAPACGRMDLPKVVTEKQFIALAMIQGRFRDRFESTACVGGVLHFTAATRAGCHQRLAATFDSYDQDAAALGDPNAAAVAALRAAAERRAEVA